MRIILFITSILWALAFIGYATEVLIPRTLSSSIMSLSLCVLFLIEALDGEVDCQ